MSKPPAVIPWSYSSLTAYETCPKRFYLTRIAKVVTEPQTEATMHGNQVHKALEECVGEGKPLPDKYAPYQPMVDKIKGAPGRKMVEYKFGLTRDLRNVGFFDKACWVRGVLDIAIVGEKSVAVLDYKTGKRKVDHDQLSLFALAGMSIWPFAKKVKTGYIWLQSDQMDTKEFTPDDKTPLLQEFAGRAHRLEEALKTDHWPANPSGLCGWCPVGIANCNHWRGVNGKRG